MEWVLLAVDFDVIEYVCRQVGTDVSGACALAARCFNDVGNAAEIDRLAIYRLGAFNGDGDFGAFTTAGFFDVFYPPGGSAACGDHDIAVNHDVAADGKIKRIADSYGFCVDGFVEHDGDLCACGEGQQLHGRYAQQVDFRRGGVSGDGQ